MVRGVHVIAAGVLLALTGGRVEAQTARERAETRKQIRRFASGDPAEIRGALQALEALGAGAVRDLVEALGDPNPDVAKSCSGTLSRIGAPAVPACVAALGDAQDQRRQQAYAALVRMGEPAVAAVEEAARRGAPRVREGALAVLKQWGRPAPGPEGGPGPAEPKPGPGAPPGTPPTTQGPRPTEVPSLRGVGPEAAALATESRAVDAAREAMAPALLERLEALVDAGKRAEARALLWGLWADAKRQRLCARRDVRAGAPRAAREAELDARVRRARDLCYGPVPPLAADDGPDEVVELLARAELGLELGDLAASRAVLQHALNRRAAGVALPGDAAARLERLRARDEAASRGAVDALMARFEELGKATLLRDGRDVEACLHLLAKELDEVDRTDGALLERDAGARRRLATAGELFTFLRDARPAAAKALARFAADAPDPDFADGAFQAYVAQGPPARKFYDTAVAGLLLAVHGEQVLATLRAGDRLGRAHLAGADAALARAVAAYKEEQAQVALAQLAQAAAALEQARAVGAPDEQVAARAARLETLQDSAGLGQLERGLRILSQARECFQLAVSQGGGRGAFDDGRARLADAEPLLVAARQVGLAPAEQARADADLARTRERADQAGAAVVRARLARATDRADEAERLLGASEAAFLALPPLEHAGRLLAEGEQVRACVGDAAAAPLGPPLAAARARVEALSARVVEAQRLPADAYTGDDPAGWRARLRALVAQEQGWEVLALTIASPGWTEKTVRYDYAGAGNTRVVETRWHRYLVAWVAVPDPEDAARVELRRVGFRQHKFTDGSYRKLELHLIEPARPMLRANLPG